MLWLETGSNILFRTLPVNARNDKICYKFGGYDLLPPSYTDGYKKRMKNKVLSWCSIFPLRKSSHQRKTARNCRTPLKNNIVSIGCYVWLLSTTENCPQAYIACWSFICYLNQLEQFLVILLGKKCLHCAYFIWLADGVATILFYCAKHVLMLFSISLYRRGLKHYILYCLEHDSLETAYINPVSTEWIVLVWSIKYVVIITKEFTCS